MKKEGKMTKMNYVCSSSLILYSIIVENIHIWLKEQGHNYSHCKKHCCHGISKLHEDNQNWLSHKTREDFVCVWCVHL